MTSFSKVSPRPMTRPSLSSIAVSASTTRRTRSRQRRISITRLSLIALYCKRKLEEPSALEFSTRIPKATGILHALETKINERGVVDPEAMYKIAQAYASIGDKASALRVLRHSIENGFFPYPYFATDPLLDSLRSEGEFSKLMEAARQRHEDIQEQILLVCSTRQL